MSAGSTPLGTLLVQRLDTMLGTTLSQQANLVSGARPDAVSRLGQTGHSNPVENRVKRHPQDNVNRAAGRIATGHTALRQHSAHEPAFAQTPTSAQLRLGATARFILDLLAQYPHHMPVETKAPLLPTPPGPVAVVPATQTTSAQYTNAPSGAQASMPSEAHATHLRAALMQTVQDSGLFYESHLAQLRLGQRNVTHLHTQPQAHVQAQAQPESIAPETHGIVRQQLEVLAHQTFTWQGQAWPGSDMTWEIQRHAPKDDCEVPEHWSSQLAVQLPTLGQVKARVTLSGQQILIHIQAPDSAQSLQQHADALRQCLAAAGLSLSQFVIATHTDNAQASDVAAAALP